jgi:ferritin
MLAEHICSEEKAARAYRYLQSWCGLNGFPGSEAFFMAESSDEIVHMNQFQAYVDDRWTSTTPPPIESQLSMTSSPKSLLECFSSALALEKTVLAQLNSITVKATVEGDGDAIRFLTAFQEVGVESIRQLTTYTQQLTLANGDACALLLFDNEIGET